ncbi:hypothetical protein LTS15_003211 [Exophiala xenobiotica]|nr:hypothetical protein LTS15_003211 [Exophiala xenobiotica]
MSRLFGAYRQNGYVVEDLDSAIKYWTEKMGLKLLHFSYLESQAHPPLNVALANFGDVQIELIQPKDNTPSPYRDFLDKKGSGLHHVCVWSDNYDADLARLAALDIRPDCTGEVHGGGRFCYFDSAKQEGTSIEVGDTGTSPAFKELSAKIHKASINWDGNDPIRDMSTLL